MVTHDFIHKYIYNFFYNALHYHRTLQTLTNCHNVHQGGKYHYLHITDGKFQAEQLGNASKTTEEVLSVPRGVDTCPPDSHSHHASQTAY